jgi:hypothetical protein
VDGTPDGGIFEHSARSMGRPYISYGAPFNCPIKASSMKPRQHPRFAAQFPATFTGDHDGEGLVINLSKGVCCITKVRAELSEVNVRVGMKGVLTVRLFVRFQEPPITIDRALAQWSEHDRFGVKFLVMNENEQQHLERYLQQTAVKPPTT